ncbi:hypothetical protein [Chitinimonas sp.]|uniref:hypothetical protein n=1 Tax=Chitinimonas sp. TaxID=1934313 RepID=UPI0035AE3CF7
MKTSVKWIMAAALACTALAAPANEEHHKNDAKPDVKAAKPSDKAVNEQMQKLQAAHDKLAAAKTPADRQMAMMEGMHAMKDSMAMMKEMHDGKGCMDMGKGMNMGGDKAGGMGMMDMMMQMMDQQSSMMSMPMGQKE